jgi:hypothetical protein
VLRSLVAEVCLVPVDGVLTIRLRGKLAAMLGVTPTGWTASGFGIDQAASVVLLELDRAAISER